MKHTALLAAFAVSAFNCSPTESCKPINNGVPGGAVTGFFSKPRDSIEFKPGDLVRPQFIRSLGNGPDGLVYWDLVEVRDAGVEAFINCGLPPGFEFAPIAGRAFQRTDFGSFTTNGKGKLDCPTLAPESMPGIVTHSTLRNEANVLVSFSAVTVPLAQAGVIPIDAPEGMSFRWIDIGCTSGPLFPKEIISASVTCVGLELTTREGEKVNGRVGKIVGFSTGGRDYEWAVSKAYQRPNNACGATVFTIYEKGFIVKKAAE
jgi:hypothetical protein